MRSQNHWLSGIALQEICLTYEDDETSLKRPQAARATLRGAEVGTPRACSLSGAILLGLSEFREHSPGSGQSATGSIAAFPELAKQTFGKAPSMRSFEPRHDDLGSRRLCIKHRKA